jgi:hypothetical protein
MRAPNGSGFAERSEEGAEGESEREALVPGYTPTDTPAAISVRQRLQNAGAPLGLS